MLGTGVDRSRTAGVAVLSDRGACASIAVLAVALLAGQADAAPPQQAQAEAQATALTTATQPNEMSGPDNSVDGDDIVVSAKREGVSVQTIPASVSVFGAEKIEALGIKNTQDLQSRVPGLITSNELGIPKVFLRGIGQEATTAGQDPGVAMHVDGVYVGRAMQAFATQIDLDRVEVLRGPQGTLYGRNATAGTVNYYTTRAKPDYAAGFDVQVGSFRGTRATAFVNGAITDGFDARIAVGYQQREGEVTNLADGSKINDNQTSAVHAALRFVPSSNLEFNLSLEAQQEHSNGPAFLLLEPPLLVPGAVEGVNYVIARDSRITIAGPRDLQPSFTRRSGQGATLTTDWSSGDVKVKSITSYRHFKHNQAQDSDATNIPFVGANDVRLSSKQFSQELNVAADIGPVDLVVGGLYFHEKAIERNRVQFLLASAIAPFPFDLFYTIDQTLNSYAGFADATVAVAPRARLIAGVRYTRDDKRAGQTNYLVAPFGTLDSCGNPAVPLAAGQSPVFPRNSISFSKWTGRLGGELDVYDSGIAYATASRGYKAGGFGDFDGCGKTFRPETVDSYEVGFKGTLANRAVNFRTAAFWMDYSDLQTQFTTFAGVSTINAKAARIKGAEAEVVVRPGGGFSFDANGSFLDAKYRDFLFVYPLGASGLTPLVLDGYRMPRAPRWSGSVGADYTYKFAGGSSLNARVEGYFTTNYSFNPSAYHPTGDKRAIQPGYGLGNAYLSYSTDLDSRLVVRGFVKNFTNKYYLSSVLALGSIGANVGFAELPRTWGIELAGRF